MYAYNLWVMIEIGGMNTCQLGANVYVKSRNKSIKEAHQYTAMCSECHLIFVGGYVGLFCMFATNRAKLMPHEY